MFFRNNKAHESETFSIPKNQISGPAKKLVVFTTMFSGICSVLTYMKKYVPLPNTVKRLMRIISFSESKVEYIK